MKTSAKLLTGLLAVTAGLSLAVAPAQAKTKSHARHYRTVKVLKKTKTKSRNVKVTTKKIKGEIFSDMHLKHKITPAHGFAAAKGVTTYNVKLRLKSGKVVNYTRVRHLTKPSGFMVTGYLRSSYLKTIKAPKKSTVTKPTQSNKPTTPTKPDKPTKQGNPNLGYHVKITADGLTYDRSNADVQPESAYTNAKYADEMLYEINEVRKDHGLNPVQLDGFLTQVASQRAKDEATSVRAGNGFGHRDANGAIKSKITASQLNPNFNRGLAECIQSGDISTTKVDDSGDYRGINPYDAANSDFYNYVFDDAMANNTHRNIILSPNYTHIGIGITNTFDPNSNSDTLVDVLNLY